jgi:formate hydrogenlyase subunit 3/multisubunit Na+/H+ antiporter MnhD subunit
MTEVFAGIALLAAAGIVSLAFPARLKKYPVILLSLAAAAFAAAGVAPPLAGGGTSELALELGFPLGLTRWAIDPLSALFSLLVAAGAALAPIYSAGYLRNEEGERRLAAYWCFLPILSASMFLVLSSRDALSFLVAWELMSLSSFLLVSFDAEEPEVRKAALYYLVAMQVGLAFLISVFALLGSKAGAFGFDELAAAAASSPALAAVSFLLLLAGFGTKMGLVPFHGWLPLAHPAAPSPASALMSGVMIKTGAYGLLRALASTGERGLLPEAWAAIVLLVVAAATGVFGALQAAAARDLKRLLAWSTAENAGIIGMGIGIGMLGAARGDGALSLLGYGAALLHCLNHFVAKSALFFGAGSVYAATGTRDLERLGALAGRMPLTAASFAAGSAAICALPPFGCFAAEFCLYLGAAARSRVSPAPAFLAIAALALIGAVSLIAFVKATGVAFLGEPRSGAAREARESPASMTIPMLLLALASLGLGLFPGAAMRIASAPAAALAGPGAASLEAALPGLERSVSGIALGSGAFLAATAAFLALRAVLLRGRSVRRAPTWGCGYRGAGSRMQYTAGSFSSSLALLFKAPLAYREERAAADWLFPPEGEVEAAPGDPVDRHAVSPIVRAMDRFLGLFSWVQSGSTRQYLLYGLVFLVAALAWLAVAP